MTKNGQVSLFEDKNTSWEIKKHSSIVQMSNVTTLVERKSMNALIRIAKDCLKRDPNQRIFTCEIGLIKRLAGLWDNDNSELKEALKRLSHTKIEYNIFNKDKEEWGFFSFLAEVKIRSEGVGKSAYITFEFPSTVLSVIKHPNMFVKLNLFIIRGLKSKHSVVLYEFMKDYQNLWRYRCDINAFRKLMGINPGQYSIFSMLRKRVLDTAIAEINQQTDIQIEYELERMGRKVTAIILKVCSNKGRYQEGNSSQTIKDKLKRFGLVESKIEELLRKHTEEMLQANIEIVEEQISQGKVKNKIGYLLKAFSEDYGKGEREKEYTIEKRKKKEQDRAEQKKKTEAEKREKTMRQNFKIREKKLVQERVESLNPWDLEKLKVQFLESIQGNPLILKIYETKGFDSSYVQSCWISRLASKLLSEEERDFESFKANSKVE